MRNRLNAIPAAVLVGLSSSIMLASCSSDTPTEANPGREPFGMMADTRVSVCHPNGQTGVISDITLSEFAARRSHGDYVTHMVVTPGTGGPDDGIHFQKITTALAAAAEGRLARGELSSAACRITIDVFGTFTDGFPEDPEVPGIDQFPLLVDVPDITLHGALVVGLDARGIATGTAIGRGATRLALAEFGIPLIIAFSHPDGSAGNGLTVEGFVLQSGHPTDGGFDGEAVASYRVGGLTVRGNRVEAGFRVRFDLRESSAFVGQNHLGGSAASCDICLAGPGDFRVTGNRLVSPANLGISVAPVVGVPPPAGDDPGTLPASADVSAEIWNNEVRDHQAIPFGVGIRVDALGLGASDVPSSSRIFIHDNVLVNNRFALLVHAGFPDADTQLRGDVDVRLGGNVIRQSCQADLLVALSRHATLLLDGGIGTYLMNSTFRINLGGDVRWQDVWYGHAEGYGNRLIVDGRTIPFGQRQFNDLDACPGKAHP
jgi:hypothetical protein